MRLAEPRLSASIITSCSMMRSFTGAACVWITNASVPRTLSPNREYTSPLAKSRRSTEPHSMPRCCATSPESSWLARPENSMRCLRPRVSTILGVTPLLTARLPGSAPVGSIVVAGVICAAAPPAPGRPTLDDVLAVVVDEHRAGADVDVLADVGVADVGEVRHLAATPDAGLLDLHVGADLAAGTELDPRPQVGEGADHGARARLEDGERLEHGVLADLDVAVRVGGGRVDHGHAGPQQPLQRAPAQHRRRLGELGAVVDAEHLVGGRLAGRHAATRLQQQRDQGGQVVLALVVVGLQPGEP